MLWNLTNDRPIYIQLMEQIKLQILSGKYPCGEHFPSVRDLALEASVNPNTMQKALSALEREGLLIGSRTQGRTVTSDEELIRKMRGEIAKRIVGDCKDALIRLGYTEQESITFMKESQDGGMEDL